MRYPLKFLYRIILERVSNETECVCINDIAMECDL